MLKDKESETKNLKDRIAFLDDIMTIASFMFIRNYIS